MADVAPPPRALDREASGVAPKLDTSSPERSTRSEPKTKSHSPRSAQDKDTPESTGKSKSKKRRKVNHACVYCRRSHMTCDQARPCSRCIKRNIGHLCHDEPREQKKAKGDAASGATANGTKPDDDAAATNGVDGGYDDSSSGAGAVNIDPSLNLAPSHLPPPTSAHPSQLTRSTATAHPASLANDTPFLGYSDWGSGSQNASSEMHSLQQNYMFNTSEVSNEYNLLNDFLTTSLIDDPFYQGDGDGQSGGGLFGDNPLGLIAPLTASSNLFATPGANPSSAMTPQPAAATAAADDAAATIKAELNGPHEKEKEIYFMTAADPAGTDTPEQRMNKLFKAKYEAGLLKPWNYVNGYVKLYKWMEENLTRNSRIRITRQMERFRPEFRKRTQNLSDFKLVAAEVWFERKLMEYDRVFASMAIPACCWRRTGEVFRGNREMSELIQVPLEELRDGKLGLHQILVEDSLTNYWEKFTSIAFDTSQKAILTGCVLKSRNGGSAQRCCFSFTVQRDPHDVPAIICGNFLPIDDK